MKRYALNLRFAQMATLDPVVTAGGATLDHTGLVCAADASPSIALESPWWKPVAFTIWGEFTLDTVAASTARLLALENDAGDYTLGAAIATGEITVTDFKSGDTLRFPLPAAGHFRLAISVSDTMLAAAVNGAMQAVPCENAHADSATLLLGGNGTVGLAIPHLAILPNVTGAALLPVLSELDGGDGGDAGINAILFPDGDPALWPDGDPMVWPG